MNSKHRVGEETTVWAITIWGNNGQCSDEKMGTGPDMARWMSGCPSSPGTSPECWNRDGCLSAPVGN